VGREIAYLEDIPELFMSRYGCRNVNNGGNALERVGEIAFHKVLDDDDVDLVAVLGVHLPQGISLSGSCDSGEGFNVAVNRQILADSLTPEHGTPLSRDVPKRVSRCIRKRQ